MNHDSSYLFAKFKTTVLNLSILYSDYAINFNYLFQYYKGSSIDISTWDTSKATNMSNMFAYQPNLQEVKIGTKWNTSGATTTNMFTGVNKGSAVLVNIG